MPPKHHLATSCKDLGGSEKISAEAASHEREAIMEGRTVEMLGPTGPIYLEMQQQN
jgi:hypothetical protein